AQIAELAPTLSALRAEEARVQKRLDAFKYPVLTLPNEITSEIFILLLPVYPATPPLTGFASPTSLTHVCRKWREIAVATPVLWRAIQFLDLIPPMETRRISTVWIQRSKSCPLSIHIDVDEPSVLDEIFKKPLTMAPARWEHLQLRVPDSFLAKITNISMPLLRSLNFVSTSTLDSGSLTFCDVPQLSTVILRCDAVSKINLPWIHLTRLTLLFVTIKDSLRILAQTRNLVRCGLILDNDYDYERELDGFAASGIILPCLQTLTMEDEYGEPSEPMGGILEYLVAPSLRKLVLLEGFLGRKPIHGLKSFISKSGCSLQEVNIRADVYS
ncbi:hypothetical protein C8R45DRAFT_780992, partial [Mycena sanguinolenta]